jgi:hypothetical protein
VLFCTNQGGLPLAARGPVVVALSCQRPVHFERAHWAHPCPLSNYLLTSRGPSVGEGILSVVHQFFTNEQLTIDTRAFYGLVTAARRKQFDAKPVRAVAVTALAYEFLPSQ